MSSNNNAVCRAVKYALYAGALATASGYGSAAVAQDDGVVEEIVTTGSRLVRQDYQAASPISTVDAKLFEDTGSPTIETVLNTMPQFVPALTSTSNNPSQGGQALVSLRGLGTVRTLVLLDGRRITPSNRTGEVDLNLIPASLIQSVEVITGGASAVYGSDAIAGVVNIKTRQFTGLELSANVGQTTESDGDRASFGITGGLESDDGRGYAFGTFNWADRDPVTQGDRSFSEVALDWDGDSFEPVGSGTIRQGRWDAIGTNAPTQAAMDAYFLAQDPGYVAGSASATGNMGFNPDGSLFAVAPVINFTGDMAEPLQPVNPASYTYNFAPPNYLETPLTRRSFFGKVGTAINDSTDVFVQAMWASYGSDTALAATPITSVYVLPNNPNLDPAVAALLATRPDPTAPFRMRKRMIESGPRLSLIDYDVIQVLGGMTGDLGDTGWEWDLYASWGTVTQDEEQAGNISRSAWYELALAPDHGASICGAAFNPFGIESIDECSTNYITKSAINTETTDQSVIEGFVRGDLFEMPAGPVQAAIGFMYKNDDYAYLPDASLTANVDDPVFGNERVDIVGFNAALPVRGKTDSTEFYVEANFPLLTDRAGADNLDVTIGARVADHSTVGNMTSFKIESIWDINESFTVRGGYQQALRAPNIGELFRPAVINFPSVGLGDPCSNDFNDPDGNVQGAQDDPGARALCVSQGIPDAVIDSYLFANTQFEGLSGGNPDLEEETADTYTIGLVFSSPGGSFQGSIDYFNIALEDEIGSIDADIFVERCFDPSFNPGFVLNSFYCNLFERDPGTGTVTRALEVDTNIAETELEGIDIQLEYGTELGAGELDIKFVASNLQSWKQAQIAGEALEEFAGTASSSFDVLPEWRYTTSFTYAVSNFDAVLRWRRVDDTTDLSFPDFKLSAVDYLDFTVGYEFTGNSLEGLRLRAGVTNLTDEDPIIYPSQQQSNTDPATYDVLGSRWFFSAIYSFQ